MLGVWAMHCFRNKTHIFIDMATFKIKSEDKAAFENRLKAQDVALSTNQIKDNKMESYFEVTVTDSKQLEIIKAILDQSPKIDVIKESNHSITRNQLKEIIRTQLRKVLSEGF